MATFLLITILLAHAVTTPVSGQSAYPPGDPSGLAAWRESLRDDETLKAYLKKRLWGDNDVMYEGWTQWDVAIWFRRDAGDLADERLHKALVEIYREAESQTGRDAKDLMTRVAIWLGVCADDATKAFLLDLAADKSKDGFLRTIAIDSYLRAADANEARDALVRFLVGSDRMASDMDRSGIYAVAYTAWEGSSPGKKLAICGALQVGLAHETTHWVFCSGDRWLSGMSLKYARSEERLALLERMYAAPVPDGELFDKRSLAPQLDEARRLDERTSVNTNLLTVVARDFNQPLSEEDLVGLAVPPPATSMSAAAPHEGSARAGRSGLYAFGGAAAAALAAVGVWLIIRRRKASRP